MRTEQAILSGLLYNEEYLRKTIAFIKDEYFHDIGDQTVFKLISDYLDKYNRPPTKEALQIELGNIAMPEGVFNSSIETLDDLS